MSNYTVGFIGGGNMARALVGGLISSGYPHENLAVAEPSSTRRTELAPGLPGVRLSDDNHAIAALADCLQDLRRDLQRREKHNTDSELALYPSG